MTPVMVPIPDTTLNVSRLTDLARFLTLYSRVLMLAGTGGVLMLSLPALPEWGGVDGAVAQVASRVRIHILPEL